MRFNTIPEITKDLRKGKIVIVIDDASRENEGDLIMAASMVKSSDINFMAKHGRGLICVPMQKNDMDRLDIHPMASEFHDAYKTAWAISCDAKYGITTGISAHDRAMTIKLLANRKSKSDDFIKPGHVFPLRSHEGGVLVRAGHTEACIDLLKLAKLNSVGVICEIMSEDGTMARTPQLIKFSKRHNLKICAIEDLIRYRRKYEVLIERITQASLPTKFGDFKIITYKSTINPHHIHLHHC